MNDEELKATLEDLSAKQVELLEEIEKLRKKPRDFWDKLGATSGLISAILLTIIGGLTIYYNQNRASVEDTRKEAEMKLQHAQTISAFIPHLASSNEAKKIAVVALRAFEGNKPVNFSAEITRMFPEDEGIRRAGDAMMARSDSAPQTQVGAALGQGEGWAYIGTFNEGMNRWETQYFQFEENAEPNSLAGRDLSVNPATGNLFVRTGMPSDDGVMSPVKGVLKARTTVKVKEVRKYLQTPYWFALVENNKAGR
jgi:hypothetical protein